MKHTFFMKKRVSFPPHQQRIFLEKTITKLNLNWKQLANKLDINESTLSKTYRFEKSRLPQDIFNQIAFLIHISQRKLLHSYNAKITNEGRIKIRSVLGENRKKMHPVKIKFTNQNLNLNINNIKFSLFDKKKGIKIPQKITSDLAEEIGMHLGDGFLSSRKYEYRLKGNKKDEKEYYLHHVKKLYKKLYNLDVNLKEYDTTFGFEAHSQAIHNFKDLVLGIKKGKKEGISIPKLIKIKDISILTAFLRGIFDTDGNIHFQSRYGYKNYYPHISLTQKSEKLIKEIWSILKMLGFNPSLYNGKNQSSVSIYGYQSIEHYMTLIGFNNPKHQQKVINWKNQYPKLSWR